MAELSKVDRLDETDDVNLSELIYGRHFRGRYEILKSHCESFLSLFLTSVMLLLSLSPKDPCYSCLPFAVVFIGSTLFALQQLSGINAVFYFSTAVFKKAGVPSTLANVFIGISNLTGVVFYFQIDLMTVLSIGPFHSVP